MALDEGERNRVGEHVARWAAEESTRPITALFGHSPAHGFEGRTAFPCDAEVGAAEPASTATLKSWGFTERLLLNSLRMNLLPHVPATSGVSGAHCYKDEHELDEVRAGAPRLAEVLNAICKLNGGRRVSVAVFGPACRKAMVEALNWVAPLPGRNWWADANGKGYITHLKLCEGLLGAHKLRIMSLPHPSERNDHRDDDFREAEPDLRRWLSGAVNNVA